MLVLRLSYIFMLLTLLYLCITSCADIQSTASTTANAHNEPATLASFSQEGFFTDSTPSLVVYPNPLNEQNCQTSNNKTWTCVVTLEGENLAGILVIWNAYTANSGISISPNKGNLAELIPTIRVTISAVPCTNTSFLSSGQVYGGGGVISSPVTWGCIPKTTPPPTTRQPASLPTPPPHPTS